MRFRRLILFPALATVAGCASQPATRPVASMPLSPPAAAPAAFAGYGSLAVPPRLADGSYVTPNRSLSAAGTLWHLRAGLNVAALACRGPEEAALIAGYNALLHRHRGAFDAAYRALGQEYRSAAAFDGAMTALYNYYALPPAQPGLCAAAQRVLAEAAVLTPGTIGGFAPTALASLEQPYTAVFARQEAWLASARAPVADGIVLIATAADPASPPRAEPAVLRR